MQIRELEDSAFSGEFANLSREELERMATAFIYDQLSNMNGYKLNEYLSNIRYGQKVQPEDEGA